MALILSDSFAVEDPALIYAMIYRESNGNPRLVSSKCSKGLMQLMDGTARDLGVQNSFDPQQNILHGTKYLKQMLIQFKGNLKLDLAAYNAGPKNVECYGGVPPLRETQDYIHRVMESYCYYQDEILHGNKRQV
jgi:soluble lytic murein transglycosylase-like protein